MGEAGENRKKDKMMLQGNLKKNGFELWRHSFSAYSKRSGDLKIFFIEFYLVNPALSLKEISFDNAQAISKMVNEGKPCFLMVKAGCWGEKSLQLHSFLPIEKMIVNKHKLNIRAENFLLTETELFGAIEVKPTEMKLHPEYLTDSGSMKWKIKLDKKIGFETKKLKTTSQTFWYVPGSKTMYGGTILLDGEEYAIVPQKSYGHSDKFWGKSFPQPVFWLSSCNLISLISGSYLPSSCFDLFGTYNDEKNKAIQVFFCLQNQNYSFYSNRSKIRFAFTENSEICKWTITAENKKNLLDVEVLCKKKEMIQKRYLNPKGILALKNFLSGGNGTGEIRLYKKVNKTLEIVEHVRVENCGCEYGTN